MNTFKVRIVGATPAGCSSIITCTEIKQVKKLDDCYYELTTQLNERGLKSVLTNCADDPGVSFEIHEEDEST